jgi:DNA polymerase-3 subunit delta'
MSDSLPDASIPLIGHRPILAALAERTRRGTFPQAILLTGPGGIGKRRLAVELARLRLCATPTADSLACGACSACGRIGRGTHPDVTWWAPPEDRRTFPIETIHTLQGEMAKKRVEGERGLALLDRAEDFSPAAANAFLKTLEEPPAGVTLILIANAQATLLPTIRSRCTIVRCRPLSPDEMTAYAKAAALPEGHERALAWGLGAPGTARRLLETGAVRHVEWFIEKWHARGATPFDFAESVLAMKPEGGDVAKGLQAARDHLKLMLPCLIAWFRDAAMGVDDDDRLAPRLTVEAQPRHGYASALDMLQGWPAAIDGNRSLDLVLAQFYTAFDARRETALSAYAPGAGW